jgi:hypothetical protein
MKIDLLYFEGCPGHEAYLPRLRELLDEAGVDATVRLIHVRTHEDAVRERFLGSPTLRVAGADIDPDAAARRDYGLTCRLYPTSDGPRGAPPDEWVLSALRDAGTSI